MFVSTCYICTGQGLWRPFIKLTAFCRSCLKEGWPSKGTGQAPVGSATGGWGSGNNGEVRATALHAIRTHFLRFWRTGEQRLPGEALPTKDPPAAAAMVPAERWSICTDMVGGMVRHFSRPCRGKYGKSPPKFWNEKSSIFVIKPRPRPTVSRMARRPKG